LSKIAPAARRRFYLRCCAADVGVLEEADSEGIADLRLGQSLGDCRVEVRDQGRRRATVPVTLPPHGKRVQFARGW